MYVCMYKVEEEEKKSIIINNKIQIEKKQVLEQSIQYIAATVFACKCPCPYKAYKLKKESPKKKFKKKVKRSKKSPKKNFIFFFIFFFKNFLSP